MGYRFYRRVGMERLGRLVVCEVNDIKPHHVENYHEEPKQTNRAFMSGMGGKPVTGYGGGAWCDRPFAVRFHLNSWGKKKSTERATEKPRVIRRHEYTELMSGMCHVCGLAKDAKGAKHSG